MYRRGGGGRRQAWGARVDNLPSCTRLLLLKFEYWRIQSAKAVVALVLVLQVVMIIKTTTRADIFSFDFLLKGKNLLIPAAAGFFSLDATFGLLATASASAPAMFLALGSRRLWC